MTSACGDDGDATGLPETLAETGLGDPGVISYTPRWGLWSDMAQKERWLYLPPGAVIDTSDMDAWRFPVGTRAWKQFSSDGVVVETRLWQKVGEGDWIGGAYLWEPDGSAAVLAPAGMTNAVGTAHDVPDQEACWDCHGNADDVLLGVSALQLAHREGGAGIWDLPLSTTPADAYELPGSADAQMALGYLHANCGNCHNDNNGHNPLRLALTTDGLSSVQQTAIYQTTVGVTTSADPVVGIDGDVIVVAGDADASVLYQRMTMRGEGQMPWLGTEEVDPIGTAAVAAWIDSL